MLIPLGDALHDLGPHILSRGKVGHSKPLALEDAEPLLHLIHPRAVRRCEVEPEARMTR